MHSITRRDEMWVAGVKWEGSGEGGGRLLYANLYEPGEMVWQYT